MKSYLSRAAKLKPTVVVLELDTPGGSVSDAENIVDLIIGAKDLRFVALVHKALSAGAAVTLTCPEIYVTEKATIGAAVSYFPDRQGRPTAIPPDVAEKFQSAWRAVCRKAADHGKHPSLLAEAMVDPNFALTMRKDRGRVVFERGGQGTLVKAKDRILTLTAKEAVSCQLATSIVDDIDGLSKALGPVTWRDVTQVGGTGAAEDSNTTVESSTVKLDDFLLKKAEELRLTEIGLTGAQKDSALRKWDRWLQEQRFAGRTIRWNVRLIDAAERKKEVARLERELVRLRRYVAAREDELKGKSVDLFGRRPMVRRGLAKARKEVRQISAELGRTKAFPIEAQVTCRENRPVFIRAWVSKETTDYLLGIPKGGEVVLTGKIRTLDVEYDRRRSNERRVMVFLDRAEAIDPTVRPPKVAAPKKRPPPTPKGESERLLRLAGTYRAAGKHEKAKELLKRVMARYPETPAARRAKKELDSLQGQ